MAFKKAVKTSAKLRMALIGPSGSGKTYTALKLATELADGKPVAVVDTERGSASKYADIFEFDTLELDTFHPARYVEAINEAVAGGYGVVVIDSLSHAWYGTGGMLELVAKQGKTFDAWGRVKPIENALLDTLTGAPIHIIATMRSKVAYEVEKDERGKAVPRKIGTAAIQREGIEYEFDIAGELDQDNTLTIQKSRCMALSGAIIAKPGKQVADTLRAWLSGAVPTPAPAPAPAPAPERHAAADSRPVVTEQMRKDRARIDAEPTDETPMTFREEPSPTAETVGELVQISLVEQIKKLKDEVGVQGPQWERMKRAARTQDELLAKLQELAEAKRDGFPLDRPAKKAQ